MDRPAIPRFSLYGEADHGLADRFVHIETIARRSGTSDWTIRPHRHAMLDHLLVVTAGGGTMLADGARHGFGQAMLTVPAGAVHGFEFIPDTQGHVVTIADPLLAPLATRDPAIDALRQAARVLPLDDPATLAPLLDGLMRETHSTAPLAAMAAEGLLHLLLVHACRAMLVREGAQETSPPRRAATLVARYRGLIERHLRDGWTLGNYAGALGTSPSRLRTACVEVAGQPPLTLLHDRLLAEARRQLCYTDRTVAEIGYDLGFDDPAYFSRAFRRGIGISPAAWRADQATATSVSISA